MEQVQDKAFQLLMASEGYPELRFAEVEGSKDWPEINRLLQNDNRVILKCFQPHPYGAVSVCLVGYIDKILWIDLAKIEVGGEPWLVIAQLVKRGNGEQVAS